MSELKIELAENKGTFEPGTDVAGNVSWSLDKPARTLELRLFWFTRGKGTEDAALSESLRFDQLLPLETRPFRFKLPEAPYSFSGKLISLVCALELVCHPSKEVVRREIVLAPGGQEIRLESVEPIALKNRGFSITIR